MPESPERGVADVHPDLMDKLLHQSFCQFSMHSLLHAAFQSPDQFWTHICHRLAMVYQIVQLAMMSLACREAAAHDALKQVQLSHQDAICISESSY